jgi:L,D-peptidoglycan transpeptidase YkuD (ErfK/YbiS/YcfS/YnhG family)
VAGDRLRALVVPLAAIAVVLALPGHSRAAICRPTLAGSLTSTRGASQLITVEAATQATTYATLTLWRRSGGCWVAAGGPWTARLGRSGLSDHHREGDGTTPTGAYGIGPVVYGTAPNPGVHYAYHQLVCGDWWDEDPASPAYNTFQHVRCGTRPAFGGGSEALWQQTVAYVHFALLDYNTSPIVPGRGSAIFLHADIGAPTNGCISLPLAKLDQVLRWLRPSDKPLIVIGSAAEIRGF